MESAKLKCRVCGKEYDACRTARKNTKVFHWQEVACSPECGAIYLQRINESRGNSVPAKKEKRKKQPVKIETVVEPVTETVESEVIHKETVEAAWQVDDFNLDNATQQAEVD